MHVQLSEILSCPECGPAQGLVVMVEELDDEGRVREGELGCSRCEGWYPVEGGVVDLVAAGGEEAGGRSGGSGSAAVRATEDEHPQPDELAVEVGALLDVRGMRGVLVLGPGLAAAGGGVAGMAEEARALCLARAGEEPPRGAGADLCTLVRSPRGAVPVLPGKAAGVALWNPSGEELEQARAALAPGARLALLRPNGEAREELAASGLEVLASEERAAVARRGD